MDFAQIKELKDKIFAGYQITAEEAFALSQTSNIEALYYSANQIRAKFKGRRFEMCGVLKVEQTKCIKDCKFCAYSQKSSTPIDEYGLMSESEAIKNVTSITEKNVKRISLASASNNITEDKLNHIIALSKSIRKKTEVKLCASFGNLNREQLKRLRNETDITTYQCNLSPSMELYKRLCTSCSYEQKIATLRSAAELGFNLCCGVVIGIGESMEERIAVAIKLREIGINIIPIHIISPQNDFKTAEATPASSEEILTTIAVYRFINPRADIRLGGGRGMIKIIEKEALRAGINGSTVGNMLTPESIYEIDQDRERFENEGFIV